MFQKNEVIFSSGIGVCKVSDIVNLSANKIMPIPYYLLCSVFDKGKISYIPVNQHHVLLRQLISPEEARVKEKSGNISSAEQKEIEYVLDRSQTALHEGKENGRE